MASLWTISCDGCLKYVIRRYPTYVFLFQPGEDANDRRPLCNERHLRLLEVKKSLKLIATCCWYSLVTRWLWHSPHLQTSIAASVIVTQATFFQPRNRRGRWLRNVSAESTYTDSGRPWDTRHYTQYGLNKNQSRYQYNLRAHRVWASTEGLRWLTFPVPSNDRTPSSN